MEPTTGPAIQACEMDDVFGGGVVVDKAGFDVSQIIHV
jgi:hypothetical protein